MAERSDLRTIRAYAGAGALTTAWRLFRDGGYEAEGGEALSTKGRLFKEQALAAAPGPARRRLFLAAAEAYGQAGAAGEAYALVNVATLWRLAGRTAQAQSGAQAVLARLDADAAAGRRPDTDYYLAATRAEALLLLGHVQAARELLTKAVAETPQAWEDHASTLRQFGLILEAMGEPADWLETLRPPRALHFAGHMDIGPAGDGLAERVREVLERERVGFGYGALAAGADIVIAEALAARGADLHLVLPDAPAAFRAASAAVLGEAWGRRFDVLLDQARSVRALRTPASAAHPLALQAATEIAMGKAVLQARACAGTPLQLVVLEAPGARGPRGSSAWAGKVWKRAGRRQEILIVPRRGEAPAPGRAASGLVLPGLVAVRAPAAGDPTQGPRLVRAAARALASGPAPLAPPQWTGRTLHLAYADPVAAAAAAAAVSAALGEAAAVGAHYGLCLAVRDAGARRLLGAAPEAAERTASEAPRGLVDLTADFAAALNALSPTARTVRVPGGVPLGDEDGLYGLAV